MSVLPLSYSLSKPIDIYTDKYILNVPYLNMVHTLLQGVGDSIEIDQNNFVPDTFRTMQYIVDSTDINLSQEQLMIIYNKTIRLKGQTDSVYYYFMSLGIEVTISYDSDDTSIMFAIIDFGQVYVKDLTAFEIGYTQLINELLFFGQGDFLYDHLEITYDFNKTLSTEVSASYTKMAVISPKRIKMVINGHEGKIITNIEDYEEIEQ